MPDIETGVQQRLIAAQVVLGQFGADVVQPVDRAELGDGLVDETLHRRLVGEVELDRDGSSARPHDVINGGLGTADVDVTDDDRGTFLGEPLGGARADAGGSAGDDEGLAVQSVHREILSRGLERSSMP
jgi:hypothetical protein